MFKEDQLFRKSPDPFGAAITKWARVWAKILSTIKEFKCLRARASKGKAGNILTVIVRECTAHFRAWGKLWNS